MIKILHDFEDLNDKTIKYYEKWNMFVTNNKEILIHKIEYEYDESYKYGVLEFENECEIKSLIVLDENFRKILLQEGVINQEYINKISNERRLIK